jgi:hypothetical protein
LFCLCLSFNFIYSYSLNIHTNIICDNDTHILTLVKIWKKGRKINCNICLCHVICLTWDGIHTLYQKCQCYGVRIYEMIILLWVWN